MSAPRRSESPPPAVGGEAPVAGGGDRRGGLRAVPVVVGLGVMALLAWWFGLGQLGEAVRRVSVLDLLLYLGLTLVVVFAYAGRWQLVMHSLHYRVPWLRLASARLAGDAVGGLLPSARLAGDPVRAAIVYAGGVDGSAAAAGVAFDRLLEIVGNLMCALIYVTVFSLTRSGGATAADGSLLFLAAVLGASAVALAVPIAMLWRGVRPLGPVYVLLRALRRGRPPTPRQSRWLSAFERAEDHLIDIFRRQPRIFVFGLLATFAIEGLIILQYDVLLSAFGVHVDVPTLLLALVGSGVARAVPSPAALGSLEGSQVAVLALAEGEPGLGFLVGLVMRLHETLLLGAGLAALSWHGLSLARLPQSQPPTPRQSEVSA